MRNHYNFPIVLIFSFLIAGAALKFYFDYDGQQELKLEKEFEKIAKEFYFKGVEDVLYTDEPEMYIKNYDHFYKRHYHDYRMQQLGEDKIINKLKLSDE